MKTPLPHRLLIASVLVASAALAQAQSLSEALDLPGVTWNSTNGTLSWSGQTIVTHDGVDAARIDVPLAYSGNYENAELSTTLTGPGVIKFWWQMSSSTNAAGQISGAYMNFTVNDLYGPYLSGNTNWSQIEAVVPNYGPNTVKWAYGRYQSFSNGFDGFWLDQVSFTSTAPEPPAITNQPTSQTASTGGIATFAVGMGGTPPFDYQWRYQGQPINGATNASLKLYNVNSGNAGGYDVVITNALGVRTSVVATLTVLPALAIGQALDAPILNWSTSGDGLWFGQTTFSHDGVDAVQTGGSEEVGYALLHTTVVGPGSLSFWWKTEFIGLTFEITNQTGTVFLTNSDWIMDWNQPVIAVGEGTHSLIWSYFNFPGHGHGEFDSRAFLDQVSFTSSVAPSDLVLLSPRITPAGKLAFDFQSKSGKNYLIQHRATLGTGTWLTLQTLPGTGSLITVTDLDPVAGTRFYQVVEQ